MKRFSELIVYFKKKGIKNTISRIKRRYFSISEFILFQRDLENSCCLTEKSADIEYIKGDIQALKQYRELHINLPREFYIDQTHGGSEFYMGYYKGDLAQICWVFSNGDYSRFFSFKDYSTCELNYIITLPQFRGKGLPAKFTNYLCEQLKNRNIKTVVVGIAASNVNMIKGMKYTGFAELKRIKSYFSIVKKVVV